MKKKIFALSLATFAIVFAAFSQSTRDCMALISGHSYIIKSVYDPTKVMTVLANSSQATMETYVSGDNDQIWTVTEHYPGTNSWFFNVANVASNITFDEKGGYVIPSKGEAWYGWVFEWNDAKTAVRMCHLLERWDYAATYDIAYPGVFMKLDPTGADNKVTPYKYARVITNGTRDMTAYNAVTTTPNGKYFDFTIVDTSTLTALTIKTIDNVGIYTKSGYIVLDKVAGMNINIFSVDGRLIKQIKSANAVETIPVQKGVYIVKANDITKKVAVN